MSDEPLITTGEVATRMGVTTSAVTAWARAGIITPAVDTGGAQTVALVRGAAATP